MGETVAEHIIEIGADYSALDKAYAHAKNVAHSLDNAIGAATPGSNMLAGALLGVAGAAGGVAAKSVMMAAEMEQSKIAFTTLLKSAEKSDAFLKDLWQFAATTPFEMKGLQDSSRMLLAFGFQANDIIPMMTKVGDSVAALGGGEFEIQRVVRALGQMKAKGKVSAEEMMQLAELGIPAWELLAQSIGTSIPEAMKKAEKGAIPAGKAIDGILAGLEQRFGGSMKAQSETLVGLWSTAKDNVSKVLMDLGDSLVKTFDLKNRLAGAITWIQEFGDKFSKVIAIITKEGAVGAFEHLFPPDTQQKIFMVSGALVGALVPALASVAAAAWAAAAPLLPFIAAGAALGAVGYLIYQNWDKVAPVFNQVKEAVSLAFAFFKDGMAGIGDPAALDGWAASAYQLGESFTHMKELVGEAIVGIKGFWDSYGAQIMASVEFQFNQILLYIETTIGLISGVLRTALALMQGDWQGAWEGIKSIGETLWHAITGTVDNMFKSMGMSTEQGLAIIGNYFAELPGKIDAYLRSLPGKLAYLAGWALGSMVRATIDGAVGLWNFWMSLPERVSNFIANLPGRLQSLATRALNMMSGATESAGGGVLDWFLNLPNRILGYISSLPTQLYNKAKTIAGNFWKGFQEGLGIHSPSYVEVAFMNIEQAALASLATVKSAVSSIGGQMQVPAIAPMAAGGLSGGMNAGTAPAGIVFERGAFDGATFLIDPKGGTKGFIDDLTRQVISATIRR